MTDLEKAIAAGGKEVSDLDRARRSGAREVRPYAPPRSESMTDEELGLMSGPVETAGPFSPRAQRNTGPLGLGPSEFQDPGRFAEEEARRNPVNDPLQVDPLLQLGTGTAMAMAAGFPFRAIGPFGPAAVDSAGASRMASSAALQAQRTAGASGADASILPVLAKLLSHGHGILGAANLAMRALPVAGRAAQVAAAPAATAAAGAGITAANKPETETAEQRAARILLEGINAVHQ